MNIKFVLNKILGAKLPATSNAGDAGYDISCLTAFTLAPNERKLVKTGVTLAYCPTNVYLRVAPRSKLAAKWGVDAKAGVIDSNYRGEIHVLLHNTSDQVRQFEKGEAIAQLIQESITHYPMCEVDETENSVRGTSGVTCEDMRL